MKCDYLYPLFALLNEQTILMTCM